MTRCRESRHRSQRRGLPAPSAHGRAARAHPLVDRVRTVARSAPAARRRPSPPEHPKPSVFSWTPLPNRSLRRRFGPKSWLTVRISTMAKTTPSGSAKETKTQILERTEREKVKFMRLQFTDILGTIKNVEIPDGQFEEALDGKIMFDGSSIEGFVRIEESDMYLRPDLSTFRIFPWPGTTGENVARMICDIYTPDGQPFIGDPRACLKKVIAMAAVEGYALNAGPEAEF